MTKYRICVNDLGEYKVQSHWCFGIWFDVKSLYRGRKHETIIFSEKADAEKCIAQKRDAEQDHKLHKKRLNRKSNWEPLGPPGYCKVAGGKAV